MNRDILNIYTDYLICQNKYATATGLSDMLSGEISHDKITRFLRSGEFGSKELWQYTKPTIRQHEQSGGVLILDDAIEAKPYTDENEVNCWHYSHAKGCVLKGMNLLSCMVRYDELSLPIGYEVINKDLQYCDLETKRVRRKASITKNELFRQLIKQACNNQVLFDYVLADNWYGAKANMEFLHNDLNKSFIIGTLTPNLVNAFHISIAQIGLLSSLLYFALAILQLPVGLLFDRFSLKLILGIAALLASIGSLLFANADDFFVAGIARVVTGVGTAFAFVGCLKANFLWLDRKHYGLVSGLTLFIGTLGALFGEGPLAWLSEQLGWRHAVLLISIIGFFCTILIFLYVPGKPPQQAKQDTAEVVKEKFQWLFAKPHNILLVLLCVLGLSV